MRDLVRAREDVRGGPDAGPPRVAKLLLRHDLRFEGNNNCRAFSRAPSRLRPSARGA
jgi:hypothetical protein